MRESSFGRRTSSCREEGRMEGSESKVRSSSSSGGDLAVISPKWAAGTEEDIVDRCCGGREGVGGWDGMKGEEEDCGRECSGEVGNGR
jgi:hypothetical protein